MEDKIMDQVNVTNKLNKWKKVLELPKPQPVIRAPMPSAEETADRKKILLAKAMKNVLRKKYSNDDDAVPKITTEMA